MDIIKTILTSLGSLTVLFMLAKVIGNRQVSQMTLFDYIIGITIGSIAAEMATSLDSDFFKPLTAMIVYAIVAVLTAYLSCKSLLLRKFFTGTPILLLENGKLYEKNLLKAKIDINEFLTQCRVAGYFDLSKLSAAVLETNGQISFLPLAKERPLTPNDMQIHPNKDAPLVNIVIDGKIINKNLIFTGNNEEWLYKKFAENGVASVDEVFLATCDIHNKCCIFKKTHIPVERDMFE